MLLRWILFASLSFLPLGAQAQSKAAYRGNLNLIELSQKLLLAAKTKEPVDSLVMTLREVPTATLKAQLSTDVEKKVFWINLYNAFTQILLANNPEQFEKRSRFFKSKQIIVGGQSLSLDLIEHGILRRSKTKWSLGYVGKIFPAPFEKKNRVEKVDSRLHFALNCGARSCPPIGFYRPSRLDEQLNTAIRVHLKNEVEFYSDSSTVFLPMFMSWFRADFGGKKGMRELLREYQILSPASSPRIRFKRYDWALYLQQYASE